MKAIIAAAERDIRILSGLLERKPGQETEAALAWDIHQGLLRMQTELPSVGQGHLQIGA